MATIDPWKALELQADQLEASLKNDTFRQFDVALVGDVIAGCVGYRVSRCDEAFHRLGLNDLPQTIEEMVFAESRDPRSLANSGYIHTLAVFPGYQAIGVGKQLLTHAEQRIAIISPQAFLFVSAFNMTARRFYAANGYTEVLPVHDLLRPGNTEMLMTKRLSPIHTGQTHQENA